MKIYEAVVLDPHILSCPFKVICSRRKIKTVGDKRKVLRQIKKETLNLEGKKGEKKVKQEL